MGDITIKDKTMKITIEALSKIEKPCVDGVEWFKAQKTDNPVLLLKAAIKSGQKEMEYINWGLCRIFLPEQRVLYACFAARQVLGEYTKKYPGDKRVENAIIAAEEWVKNPCEETRSAAWSAARSAESAAWSAESAKLAARSAAWSARSAAWSVESAVWSAAEAAAESAESAVSAVWSAAESAAESAEYNRMLAKIIRYGVKLLLSGEGEK